MWVDSRAALADLDLAGRERVLDVGCGTGELTRVLREETPDTTQVVGVDVDPDLLAVAAEDDPVVRGDALRLPVPDDAVDLVVCQALLINLPDPAAALAEFTRVSTDRVAAIEPDNGAVTIDSTVQAETALSRQARERFLSGVETDVTLGGAVDEYFEAAGLAVRSTRRYDHERTVAPPYSTAALEAAQRKASGEGLAADRETLLAGDTSPEEFDQLRQEWRAMGRTVIEQMGDHEYERTETVPFFVTVGRVD